jgi:hypothetical protein
MNYTMLDMYGADFLYEIELCKYKEHSLWFTADIGSQTDLISTLRDTQNDRRVRIVGIRDALGRQDLVNYFTSTQQQRTYEYTFNTKVITTVSLPTEIKYHNGRITEFTFYNERFDGDTGYVIPLLEEFRYNLYNMQAAFRDCLTNYMINTRKQIKGTQTIKKETYSYTYTGDQTSGIGYLLRNEDYIYNITTGITTNNYQNNQSGPDITSITKQYGRYRTGYLDVILGDFSSKLKLDKETIKDYISGDLVQNEYTWDMTTDGNYYTGSQKLESLIETKTTNGSTISRTVKQKNYTFEGFLGKNILKSEDTYDDNSLYKNVLYKNFIPIDENDITAFYQVGLVDEEKVYSVSSIKNHLKNLYYDDSHDPVYNPLGIFRGKLKKSYTNYHSRPSETFYQYNSWEEDSVYAGFLKSAKFDNNVRQEYFYPQRYYANFNMKWSVKDSIVGRIVYHDNTEKDSLFFKKGFQSKPTKTLTIFNDGLDTLTSFTAYNLRGSLLFEIGPNGKYSEYSYDPLNRITSATLPGSYVDVDTGVTYQQQVVVADTLVFGGKYGSYITRYSDGTSDNQRLQIIKVFEHSISIRIMMKLMLT